MDKQAFYDEEYYHDIEHSRPRNEVNWWSVAYRKKLLKKLFAKRKLVCDVGCGPGDYVAFCVRHGITAAGVDISSKAIAHCRKTVPLAAFAVCDAENRILPWKCDGVFIFDVIEHTFNYDRFLKNIYVSMTKGGIALLSTQNIISPRNRIGFLFGSGDPFFDKAHLHFFTPLLFKQALRKAGFKNIQLFGTGKLAWVSISLAGNLYALVEK